MVNPAILINNWGAAAPAIEINGVPQSPGDKFKYGYYPTLDVKDGRNWQDAVIVWFQESSISPVTIKISPSTVGIKSTDPIAMNLYRNYPNPFNPMTNIPFAVSQPGKVTITVYDVLGRKVATLVNEEKSLGNHVIEFDGSNLASGLYYYRMEVNGYRYTKKMLLLK